VSLRAGLVLKQGERFVCRGNQAGKNICALLGHLRRSNLNEAYREHSNYRNTIGLFPAQRGDTNSFSRLARPQDASQPLVTDSTGLVGAASR